MTAFTKVATFLEFLKSLVHASLAELPLFLQELYQPFPVHLTLLEVSIFHFNRRVVEENLPDFRNSLGHVLFFGFANGLQRTEFLDELQPRLWPDALDAWVVVGADHDG